MKRPIRGGPCLSGRTATPDELDDALAQALRAEFTVPRSSRAPSLLAVDRETQGLTAHDYVLDDDQQHRPPNVPDFIWDCALAHASEQDLSAIAFAAYQAGQHDYAAAATEPLANAGHAGAMFNLGLLLEDSDPPAARGWYERAADAGDAEAMNNLGVLLADSGPASRARAWYRARRRRRRQHGAMNNLGVLLKTATRGRRARPGTSGLPTPGTADAMFNLGRAAQRQRPEAGAPRPGTSGPPTPAHADAMNNLGVLLETATRGRARVVCSAPPTPGSPAP